MNDGYAVDATALEADAKTFDRWAKKLETIRTAIPVGLTADNFSYIPQAQDVHRAYMASAKALQEYVEQGSVVFDGFERTLLKTVLTYADAEKLSAEDIARVRSELEAP
ncbi:MAG: hypothetical protein ABI400_02300 [Lacisediminihabitans sp.]